MLDALIDGFDPDAFCAFLRSKFPSFSESRRAVRLDAEFPWASAQQLGVVKTLAGPNGLNMPMLVVMASLPDGEPLRERSSRVRQFNFARKVIGQALAAPAPGVAGAITQGLFVFHDADGNFRLSLVYGKAEGTKLVWSTARRLSFYIEAGAGNKTFRDRARLDWSTFEKLKEAFSVEKLTKEFYGKLFDWYQWALSDEMGVTYPNNTDTDDDEREINEHIIRLITRLMFVWFLKQKHLVPAYLFDPPALKTVLKNFDPLKGDNYYRAVLQNLFFATLNSEIPERAFAVDAGNIKENKEHFDIKTLYRYGAEFAVPQDKVLKLFEKIPFLNGGLFECLDRGNKYADGFSRNARQQAHLPNRLFFDPGKGLIPLLSQYHFTVEENSPGDEEVALDPELLGKVFENLLGAYNPETKVAARNATGSFYTPREIVNYMVDESLKAHVLGRLDASGTVKGAHEEVVRCLFTDGTRPPDEALCRQIDEALVTAKILDPACGSGAFPMGILLRMVELLRILRKIGDDDHTAIYDLKLRLIENCIYGGDIQSIAVQISKLRFFISLVCEQKPTADPKKNYGINTLPNLETKFVAADSLIGLPRSGDSLPMANVEKLKRDLWEVRHKHFQARTYQEKKELRKEDKKLRTALARALEEGGGFDTAVAAKMAAWDPYDQNTSATWSDPEWMFNVKFGFDIVIGNPPFGRKLNDVQKNHIKAVFKTASYQVDLYIAFIELCTNLSLDQGVISLITPNSWLKNMVMEKLRRFVLENLWLRILVPKISGAFDSASVETSIIIAQKTDSINTCAIYHYTGEKFVFVRFIEDINRFADNDKCVFDVETTSEIRSIIQKIQNTEETVNSLFDVNRGINPYDALTGQPQEIIKSRAYHATFRKDESFVPELKGRHVKPFLYHWDKKHYISYGPWLAAPRDPKYFTGKRIIFREILADRLVCTIIEEDFKIDRSLYIAIPKRLDNYDLEFVLGLLVSKLFSFFIRHITNEFDQLFPKVRVAEFRAIPVLIVDRSRQRLITSTVRSILAAKKADPDADTSAWEAEIDRLVYALYGLTEEEIAIVEGSSGGKAESGKSKAEIEAGEPEDDDAVGRPASGVTPKKPAPRKLKANLPPSLPGWD